MINRFHGSFLGLRIIEVPHWPRELIGHEIKEVRAHPAIAWILRRFRKSDHVKWIGLHRPISRPIDPVFDQARGAIYLGPEQAAALLEIADARGLKFLGAKA